MFQNCGEIIMLDLTNFKTSQVTSMAFMFDGCSKLETIYATSAFRTSSLNTNGRKSIFEGCIKLKGGTGTTYSENPYTSSGNYSSHDDSDYVRIDDGGTNYGYFTQGPAPSTQS